MRHLLTTLALTGCVPHPAITPGTQLTRAERTLAEATQLVQERQNCDGAFSRAITAKRLAGRSGDGETEREAWLVTGLAQQCRGHSAEAVNELAEYLHRDGANPLASGQLIAACHASFGPEGIPAPGPAREELRQQLVANGRALSERAGIPWRAPKAPQRDPRGTVAGMGDYTIGTAFDRQTEIIRVRQAQEHASSEMKARAAIDDALAASHRSLEEDRASETMGQVNAQLICLDRIR